MFAALYASRITRYDKKEDRRTSGHIDQACVILVKLVGREAFLLETLRSFADVPRGVTSASSCREDIAATFRGKLLPLLEKTSSLVRTYTSSSLPLVRRDVVWATNNEISHLGSYPRARAVGATAKRSVSLNGGRHSRPSVAGAVSAGLLTQCSRGNLGR